MRLDVARVSRAALLALALVGASTSCGGAAADAQPVVATAAVPAKATTPARSTKARVELHLRAAVEPSPRFHVEVVASGLDLATWTLEQGAPAALVGLAARDDTGKLDVATRASGEGATVTFGRAPTGAVHVTYDVLADAPEDARAPLRPTITKTMFYAGGEALALLPAAADDAPVIAQIEIDADALGATGVASSLGVGRAREREAKGRVLRHAAFVGGQLGTALFHAIEADDETAWVGPLAFDARAAASEAAIVRGVVQNFFGGHDERPMPLLVVGHTQPQRLLSMSRRADSLLLHVGLQEPWGAAPRITLAHAMVQTWIGGVLWIGPDDAAHEAESYWFTEGVARYFAREILFRVGLLDPDEYRDAIALDLAIAFTSRRKGESNAALAAHVADEGALGLLVARGSLYALGASARIRQRTAGKRSLDAVMLALFRTRPRGEEARAPGVGVARRDRRRGRRGRARRVRAQHRRGPRARPPERGARPVLPPRLRALSALRRRLRRGGDARVEGPRDRRPRARRTRRARRPPRG